MPMPLPVVPRLDAGLPFEVTSHKSGGRDVWTGPLAEPPADPLAASWAAIDEVLDPEIPISLVELGLIYGVELEGTTARVRLTYTATGCPCMEFIREDLTDRLTIEAWIDRVEIEEVWSPPWTSERITPEGRTKLKQLGVGV
jgi:metal-sulfur cluster biosynthetic enzyme